MEVEKIKSFMDEESVKSMKEDLMTERALDLLVAAAK